PPRPAAPGPPDAGRRPPRPAPPPAPADDRAPPREIASLQHLEVRRERRSRRRQAKRDAARPAASQVALVTAEIELHERAARKPPGAVVDQGRAQETRLEDGAARSQPTLFELRDHVAHLAVGV